MTQLAHTSSVSSDLDIRSLFLAQLKSPQLKDISDRELLQLTNYISSLCGISKLNTIEDDRLLIHCYRNVFGTVNIDEIKFAFENYVKGIYQNKIQHYQVLSAKFIGEVLQEYHNWKRNTLKSLPKLELPQQVVPHSLRIKMTFEGLSEYVCKYNKMPITWAWGEAFEYAERTGLIKKTNAEKEEIKARLEKNMHEDVRGLAKSKIQLKEMMKMFTTTGLKSECHKYCLTEYFKNKIK